MNVSRRTLLILLSLVAVTIAAYWPAGDCGFVNYDDPGYVTSQPMVNQGLRGAAICWVFTAPHAANWHPLTSLSHMLDCSLFGMSAGPPHWINVGLHALNVALVFLVWQRLSGAVWASALVAALFALHPLHVESVAWISERKDVLSTAFWLATLWAYAGYVNRPTRGRYFMVLLGFACGLMAKPMTVTLPCTLLLLDYWPLRRWQDRSWRALVLEKVPLFALAVVFSIITFLVQRAAGAADYGNQFSFPVRLGNALVSYVRYLGKMIWPEPLAPFYPHPGWWPWWAILVAVALLGAVSWLAWRERTRRPWLMFGWCWFLGTLVPVIGVVQVGAHSISDRYTYVPLLGIFTILAWSGAELMERRPQARWPLASAAGLALAACLLRTHGQIGIWKNGVRLFEHTLAVLPDNATARTNLALTLDAAGRPQDEVIAQYRRALELEPDNFSVLSNLGLVTARAGRFEESYRLLDKARDISPSDPKSYVNLAGAYMMEGRLETAAVYLRRALELQPHFATAHHVLGQVLVSQGRLTDARVQLREAIRDDPWNWLAQNDLAVVTGNLGDYSESRACLERALWIHPGYQDGRRNLQHLRKRLGEITE